MRIHKPDELEVVLRSYVDLAGKRVLSVGVISSFALHPDAALGPREQSEVWPLATAAIGEMAPLDEGWAKFNGEFFVYGAAYMPRGGTEQPISVRAQLGSVQKQLAVYGDRTLSAIGPSEPAPFWKMPLTPQNAYGGRGHDMNPRGKGYDETEDDDALTAWQLPNVENPADLIVSRSDRPDPAGFWALSAEDSRRMRHFGSVDEQWLKTRWPHLPLDTAPGYFQAAAADQQANGFWRGDEPFALFNLHPVISRIEGKLPALAVRVLAARREGQGEGDLVFSLANAVPETVWFFPDYLKGLILHRAVFEVDQLDGDDIAELYAQVEPMSAPASSLDTLKAQMLAAIAAADDLGADDDFQLEQTEQDANQTVEPYELAAPKAELTKKLDSLEQWQEVPATQDLPIPPSKLVTPMAPITPKIAPETAAELAALKSMIEQSKQTIQSAFKNTDMTEKDLLEMLFSQPDAPDIPDVFKQAPNGITGVLDDMQADIEKLFITDAEINAAVEQEALETPAEPEPVAEQEPVVTTDLRQTVVDMHGRGESLAELDLSATDLSGLDLSGADFSGATLADVNFAQAQLERCKFDGAILSGAVFSGATLRFASFKAVSAGQSNFEAANLDSAVLFESDFSGSNFAGASLVSATLRTSVFSQAQMAGVKATDAVADEAIFDEANLDGANLSSARLKSTQFSNASMVGANLSKCIGPRLDLTGANLSGANLSGAYLENCTASDTTDLSNAMLRETVLTSCNWQGVNLEDADLSEASMDQADFMGAKLRNAKMMRAVARGAVLDKADLTGLDGMAANFFEGGFRGSKLKATLFGGANLFAADFSDAVIDSVDLEGTNIERTIIKLRHKHA